MTTEEFAVLTPADKWKHISHVMAYIMEMDNTYSLRRRYNLHHTEEQVKQEERSMRTDQYQRWAHIKDLYATHRDELQDTMGEVNYQDCKSVLEKVFTMELDDALRSVIDGKS